MINRIKKEFSELISTSKMSVLITEYLVHRVFFFYLQIGFIQNLLVICQALKVQKIRRIV